MMLGTSFASVSIIMTSSIFGIPISGTHTVVGAIIGASLATAGKDSVDWSHLLTVVLSWFVSPVVAGIISGLLFIILCILTLDPNSFKARCGGPNCRLLTLSIVAGATNMFQAFLLLSLVQNDLAPSDPNVDE
jgi:phosphate/sulfate permease